MAGVLKTMEETVNTKLVNPDSLYINSSAMNTICDNIKKDMDLIGSVFTDISEKSKKAVTNDAFYDSEDKSVKAIASSAKKRAHYCKTQSARLVSKIKVSNDTYRMQLLENRVSELELALSKLTSGSK